MPKKRIVIESPLSYRYPYATEIGLGSALTIINYQRRWKSSHSLFITLPQYADRTEKLLEQLAEQAKEKADYTTTVALDIQVPLSTPSSTDHKQGNNGKGNTSQGSTTSSFTSRLAGKLENPFATTGNTLSNSAPTDSAKRLEAPELCVLPNAQRATPEAKELSSQEYLGTHGADILSEEALSILLQKLRSKKYTSLIAFGGPSLQWTVKLASLFFSEEQYSTSNGRDTSYKPIIPLISLVTTPWMGVYGEGFVRFDGEAIVEPTLYPRVMIMDESLIQGDIEPRSFYPLTMAMILMGGILTPRNPLGPAISKGGLKRFLKSYTNPTVTDLFTLGATTEGALQMNYRFPQILLKELILVGEIPTELVGTFLLWALCKRSAHMSAYLPPSCKEERLQGLQEHLYKELRDNQVHPNLRACTNTLVPQGTTKEELIIIRDILDAMDWYQRGRVHL